MCLHASSGRWQRSKTYSSAQSQSTAPSPSSNCSYSQAYQRCSARFLCSKNSFLAPTLPPHSPSLRELQNALFEDFSGKFSYQFWLWFHWNFRAFISAFSRIFQAFFLRKRSLRNRLRMLQDRALTRFYRFMLTSCSSSNLLSAQISSLNPWLTFSKLFLNFRHGLELLAIKISRFLAALGSELHGHLKDSSKDQLSISLISLKKCG